MLNFGKTFVYCTYNSYFRQIEFLIKREEVSYKAELSLQERLLVFVSYLPWRFKKFCPSYLRELDSVCKKVIALGGKILSKERLINIEYKGINYSLRIGSTDFLVFDQVIIEGEYKPVINLIKEKLINNRNLKIIDAGANVGFSSLFFANEFADSTILAIEPDQSNFDQLCKHIKLNNLSGNIIPLNAGIWGKNTNLKLNSSFRDGREWALNLEEANDSKELVPGFTLENLLENNNWEDLDFIKIDIEGGEKNLFDEWKINQTALRKVKYIALEIHDEIANRIEITETLKNCGFDITEIGETTFGQNKFL